MAIAPNIAPNVFREALEKNQVLHGDCLELMRDIPDKSIDMILCDLPYGTTACKWDVIIPFEPLWEQYKRIVKPNAAIVLTASQPFTTDVINSNREWFKYCWYWIKNRQVGFAHSKNRPMMKVEDIAVFSSAPMGHESTLGDKRMNYNPQGIKPIGKKVVSPAWHGNVIGKRPNQYGREYQAYTGFPSNVLYFDNILGAQVIHPTQKPVALFEYLIKTYTNEGDLVLDNCAGSGTTAIAALNTDRNYILMEKELDYFNLINGRLADALSQRQPTLFERVQWLETQVQAQSVKIKKLECHHQLSLFG